MKTAIKTLLLTLSLGVFSTGTAMAVPSAGKVQSEQKTRLPVQTSGDKASQSSPAGNSDKTSINTASAEELARVMNGVGLKKAQSIVKYREEYGPFKSLDELRQVPGMGGALVERNLSFLSL